MDDRPEDQTSPADPILLQTADIASGRPWQPGLLKYLPWTGLLSLLAGFICGIGAVVVAHDFDDQPLDHWKIRRTVVQPTVLLSVLATVSKSCLGYAFTTGVTLFWWKSAVSGTSLHELHVSYRQSNSLQGLFRKRPNFNSVAVASVATLLLMAEGPLLQRALHVVTRERHIDTELTIPISSSPLITSGTGIVTTLYYQYPQLYNPSFAQIVQQYNAREDIVLPDFGCHGTCLADIITAGWDIECSTIASDYKLMSSTEYAEYVIAGQANHTWTGTPREQVMFATNATFTYVTRDDYAVSANYQIRLDTMYKATEGINGTVLQRTCTLSEATTSYRVRIIGRTITLQDLPQMLNRTFQKTWRYVEYSGSRFNSPSTTGGLWLALKEQYQASATIACLAGAKVFVRTKSTAASIYMRGRNASSLATCDIYWADPTVDMISMLQELTFRFAVATSSQGPVDLATGEFGNPSGQDPSIISPNLTATNRTVQQRAAVSMTYDEIVYAVRYSWLIAGFALIVLACLAVFPTYWGWWLLGRPVSLSPLEIAKAFDAPLLRGADPNGTSKELARAFGDVRVRYGPKPSFEGRHSGSDYEMDFINEAGLQALATET